MRTWSERSIKNLTGCHPDLQRVLNVALQISPVDFGVIDGLRTKAEQVKNVEAGASQTLDSRHLQGCAVDVIAAVTKGSDPWKFDLYIKISAAVKAAAAIEQVPVVWGGDWKSLKDGGHFELKKSAYPNGVEYTPGPSEVLDPGADSRETSSVHDGPDERLDGSGTEPAGLGLGAEDAADSGRDDEALDDAPAGTKGVKMPQVAGYEKFWQALLSGGMSTSVTMLVLWAVSSVSTTIAAPTPMPTKPHSAIGVSMTRFSPVS